VIASIRGPFAQGRGLWYIFIASNEFRVREGVPMPVKRLIPLVLAMFVLAASGVSAWERNVTEAPKGFRKMPNKKAQTVTCGQISIWRTSVQGDVAVKGMQLDLGGEAGFATENRYGGQVSFGLTERTNLVFAYNSFENSGLIRKNVTFDGRKYNNNAALRLKTDWFDVNGAYRMADSDSAYWDFLYGLKVSHASLDVSGYAPVTGAYQSGSYSNTFPIPYIGIGGGAKLSEKLWVDGHLKYVSANVGGGRARSFDADLNVGFDLSGKPAKKMGIRDVVPATEWIAVVGYRNFLIDGTRDADTVNIGYRGPTVGLVGRWF